MNVLEELKGAEPVGITGHIRPDGDCIGSCMGLYSYLKDNCPQLDVTVYLETPGSEFHYIRDIDKIQTIPDIKKEYDVFFVLDCSSLDRIEPFHSCFENAKKTVCIDHHISNGSFADVNVVDAQASSAWFSDRWDWTGRSRSAASLPRNAISSSVQEGVNRGVSMGFTRRKS